MTQPARPWWRAAAAVLLAFAGTALHAGPLDRPECVVPAKPGGGFDLTCRLAQSMLAATKAAGQPEMALSYLPGGIGALAFDTFVRQRTADDNTIVAFSTGSLLNLAQGRFGARSEKDVRWLAAIGADHGVIAVARNSPFRTLDDLVQALRSRPNDIAFGAGGTIGSQDWVKAALLARAAGVSHKVIRFVAFEGGGDALKALEGGHVQVVAGDAAELTLHLAQHTGVRVLAVLSGQRLPGRLASVPTAREQGFDIQWVTVRGFYMGRGVSDVAFRQWVDAFERARGTPAFVARRAELGLAPFWATGPELDRFITEGMTRYRRLAQEFQLPVR